MCVPKGIPELPHLLTEAPPQRSLLHSEGVFSVIIPADGKESFLMAATRYG